MGIFRKTVAAAAKSGDIPGLNKRQLKYLARQEKAILKSEAKARKARNKHEHRMAQAELQKIRQSGVTPQKVARFLGAARLVLPVVLPLLYRGVTFLQEQWNKQQAAKLGVAASDLAQFSGPNAPLLAKIKGLEVELAQLREESQHRAFAIDAAARLEELEQTVRSFSTLSPAMRVRVHQSAQRDLERLSAAVYDRRNS